MSLACFDFERVERARRASLRFGRVSLELPVELHHAEASSVALMTNVGVAGAFVVTPRAFCVGDRLTLRFTLAGYGAPLSVTAEVRWLRRADEPGAGDRPAGVGVRFIAPRSGVSIRLARLLRLHASR